MRTTNYKFTSLGNSLVMNFLNTVQRHHHKVIDLLQDDHSVMKWGLMMRACGELHPLQYKKIFQKEEFNLIQLKHFRDECRQMINQLEQNDKVNASFWRFLEEKINDAPMIFQVSDEQIVPIPYKSQTSGLLSLLSYDFLKLKEKDQLKKIKNCANTECLALFIDLSGKRKWCSMKECGNRNKVNRFINRQKEKC